MSDDESHDLSEYRALSPVSTNTLPDPLLASKLREIADQIMLLEKRFERMPRGAEKFKVDKVLKQLRDDFCGVFNHNEVWDEYHWADGLTVSFVGPSISGSKLRGRVRPVFSWKPDGLAPSEQLR